MDPQSALCPQTSCREAEWSAPVFCIELEYVLPADPKVPERRPRMVRFNLKGFAQPDLLKAIRPANLIVLETCRRSWRTASCPCA
jgi:hypothetical protein